MKTWIIVLILLNVLPAITRAQSRPSDNELKVMSNIEAIKEGRMLPDIRLPNEHGDTTKLSDFNGQHLFLNFWATWCKPCIEHMDFYKSLSKDYEKRNIKFVFISIDKDVEAAKRFIAREKIPGIHLLAGGFTTPPVSYFIIRAQWENDKLTDYDQGIPRYFMVNKERIITHSDLQNMTENEIAKVIKNQMRKD